MPHDSKHYRNGRANTADNVERVDRSRGGVGQPCTLGDLIDGENEKNAA
ncbi:MAG: hypothetical protein IIB38_08220 [Candidatus Hydrogenedentes bacterium]|nr:hypothetical protein [Candidatus Hydrogenedentota bacterium]